MNETESPNLDALRSVAIITVLIDHLIPTLHLHLGFGSPELLAFTAHIGQAGVLAFFVHTSLVLMFSLERLAEKPGSVTLNFYIRRFFRIYPLSWAVIAFVLIFSIPSNTWRTPQPMSPDIITANVLLIQNIYTKKQVTQPLWSLAYEVQMYIVLPALFFITRRKLGGLHIALLTLIFSAFGVFLSFKTGRLNMAAYIPCFLAGVLCYSTRHYKKKLLPGPLWLPLMVAMVAGYSWLQRTEPEPVYWEGWIYCLALAALINIAHDSTSSRLNWATHQIAKYSYGLYLLHVPVLYLIFSLLEIKTPWLASILLFTLTLAFSIISFHLIENPFISIGRRLSSTPRSSMARTAG